MGEWPKCACGCGEPVLPTKSGRPSKYAAKRCQVRMHRRRKAEPWRDVLYRCTKCGEDGFTFDEMALGGGKRKDGSPRVSWCRACKSAHQRRYDTSTPERRARKQARAQAYLDRMKAEDPDRLREMWREAKRRQQERPAGLEKARATARRYQARVRADDEARERRNRKVRERRVQIKAEDPERWRAICKAKADAQKRRMKNPTTRRKYLETRRLWEAEKRAERGMRVGTGGPRGEVFIDDEVGGLLPVAPVAAFIDELVRLERLALNGHAEGVDVLGNVCRRLEVSTRDFTAWRDGERHQAQFDVVDRVVTRGDVCWWDVFDEARWPEAYQRAAELFEG